MGIVVKPGPRPGGGLGVGVAPNPFGGGGSVTAAPPPTEVGVASPMVDSFGGGLTEITGSYNATGAGLVAGIASYAPPLGYRWLVHRLSVFMPTATLANNFYLYKNYQLRSQIIGLTTGSSGQDDLVAPIPFYPGDIIRVDVFPSGVGVYEWVIAYTLEAV